MSSLLSYLADDSDINVEGAINFLKNQSQDNSSREESCYSLLDCLSEDGELDVEKYLARQGEISLFDMSLLMERGVVGNDGQINPVQRRPFTPRKRHSMFYQIETSSGLMRAATPADCQWYKMYIEYPMINVPKFHVVFQHCFRLPYAQFVQLLRDAHEKDWFPQWTRWNSKSPLSLLI